MKGSLPAILVLLLTASHLADAQQPAEKGKQRPAAKKLAKILPELPAHKAKRKPATLRPKANDRAVVTTGDRPKSMSTDLWIYLQERKREQDPRYLVRKKAAQKAAQRRARLASMKWIGYSNSRPLSSPSPQMSISTPHFGATGLTFTIGGGYWSSFSP